MRWNQWIDESPTFPAGMKALLLRRLSLALSLVVLMAAPLPAEDRSQEIAELEGRLAAATGRERLEVLVELSELYDHKTVISIRGEAFALLVDHPDPLLELSLAKQLLYAHASLRELPAALEMGSRAARLARRLDDPVALGQVLRRLGDVYRYRSDFEKALSTYREAIHYSEQAGDQGNLGSIHNNMARILLRLGRHAEGLASLLSARDGFAAAGDMVGVGTTLANIGREYRRSGEGDAAMEYFEEALRVAKRFDHPKLQGHCLSFIAIEHLERGELQRAHELTIESLELFQRFGRPASIAQAHSQLADVHLALGELEQATTQTRQSIELAEEFGDIVLVLSNRQRLAQIADKRGDRLEAIRELETVERRAREIGREDQLGGVLLQLADLYAEQQRYKQAYAAFREHEELKSRDADEKSRQALARMQANLDLERREKELETVRSQQALQAIELRRQTDRQRGLLLGFGLVITLLGLAFNRYRHRVQADRLRESVAQAEAVNERLRAIDRLKDDFLAATSHELRTPLFGITGLVESLASGSKGELPVSVRSDLDMVVASGRRLSRLVDDILDFSKLQRASLALDRRPVELSALVDIVLTLSRPLAAGKNLELKNGVTAELPPVLADENRVQQILHNLVGNAIKFTDSGHVEVAARAEDGRLVIEVSDTGIGIEEQHRERIFAAFEQAEGAVDRRFGGTGLGLAVSRQLVGLHGGELWLESTSEAGSTFAFTLPLATGQALAAEAMSIEDSAVDESPAAVIESVAPDTATPIAQVNAPPMKATETESDHPHILVVDDEPVNRQVLSNHLGAVGYRIALASDGPEALRRLGEQHFDLVLLDIMMPRMSGYEVCRELRERYPAQELPVLFLTAKARQEDQITGLDLGANDYLTKPVSRATLLARVRTHVELLEAHRKQLAGLVPICAECKKIRDDEGYWEQVETFISSRSHLIFSHSLCPTCLETTLAEVKAMDNAELQRFLPS